MYVVALACRRSWRTKADEQIPWNIIGGNDTVTSSRKNTNECYIVQAFSQTQSESLIYSMFDERNDNSMIHRVSLGSRKTYLMHAKSEQK